MFEYLHATGLSWAVVIPMGAIIIRAFILTSMTLPERNAMQRRLQLEPFFTHHQTSLKHRGEELKGLEHTDYNTLVKQVKRQQREFHVSTLRAFACSPSWHLLPLLQFPLFLVTAEAMRSMIGMQRGLFAALMGGLGVAKPTDALEELGNEADTTFFSPEWYEPTMTTEGLPWMLDLTVADPTLTLPFIVSGLMCANILRPGTNGDRIIAVSPRRKGLERGLVIASLLIGPLTLHLPAGILYYWASSSAAGLVTNLYLDYYHPIATRVRPCERPLRFRPWGAPSMIVPRR